MSNMVLTRKGYVDISLKEVNYFAVPSSSSKSESLGECTERYNF
jgi:hypothetical protein